MFSVGDGALLVMVTNSCFLIGVLILCRVHIPTGRATRERGTFAGLRLLFGDPVLRATTCCMALVLCSAGLIDGALYAMIDSLRKPPSFSGFIVGAQGQGMVGGSFLAFMFFRLRAAEKSMADWLLASSTQPHLPHGGFLDHEAPLPPRDASYSGRLVDKEAFRGRSDRIL
ncbi:MAG: hypothetical protein LKI24_08385 [Acidipropionibacterium sp.]|jgi:hypothetical protein|nr:hypothetical protein [Acidipropionibacterium sp.]